MSKLLEINTRGAVVVCEHVAELGYPILRAKRDQPDFPEDTGWQFLCNRHKPETKPLFWSVEEIVVHDPSVDAYLDCPPGTEMVRADREMPWQATGC